MDPNNSVIKSLWCTSKTYILAVIVAMRQTGLSSQCSPRWDAAEWSGSTLSAFLPVVFRHINGYYPIYPKYWDTLPSYHTSPKIWNSAFYHLLMFLNYCCMYGKQCRPWSDAVFWSIWSGSTLFAMGLSVPILRVIKVKWIYSPFRTSMVRS